MELILLFLWVMIINGGLGGQYILNWMGNQPEYVGNKEVGVSPGVMTWWRELSKLLWAAIAVLVEVIRGKEVKYLWPGSVALITIMICAFTGVIENIGFFFYYSHSSFPQFRFFRLLLQNFMNHPSFNITEHI